MTTQKIAQIIMLLVALVIGATAPVHTGQTMLALALFAGVLLFARMGSARPAVESAE